MEKKTKQTRIAKITLEVEGHTITLSTDAAKKLKAALEELFGKTEVVRHEHHNNYYPKWDWWKPITYGVSSTAIGELNKYQANLTDGYSLSCTAGEIKMSA